MIFFTPWLRIASQRVMVEPVVVVILQRHFYRFAHGLQTGEVYDAVDIVLFKYPVERFAVAHVSLVEYDRPAGYLPDAAPGLGAAVDEIVDDDDVHTALQKLDAGVAADIAHAARYQNCHIKCSNQYRYSTYIL